MEIKTIISYLFLLQALTDLLNIAAAPKPGTENNVYKCRDFYDGKQTHFKTNVNTAFSVVAKNMGTKSNNHFYHTTISTNNIQVNAIGFCPNYLGQHFCELCVTKSTHLVVANCHLNKEGVAWFPDCMVRYSGRKISGVLDDWFWVSLVEKVTVNKPREMDKALNTLVNKLQGEAAGGSKKYASGNMSYAPDLFLTVHAVMQCTPDLSKEQCSKCLKSTIVTLQKCCFFGNGKCYSGSLLAYFNEHPEFEPCRARKLSPQEDFQGKFHHTQGLARRIYPSIIDYSTPPHPAWVIKPDTS